MAEFTRLFPEADRVHASASFPAWPTTTRSFPNLRFRTRLALVMFLTMACTSAILTLNYVQHNQQIKAYVATQASDILTIVNVVQQQLPPDADRKRALEAYMTALTKAGLKSVTLASPAGVVEVSTNPGLVGKKLKKRRVVTQQNPVRVSAELKDIDASLTAEQRWVQFPMVQGDKVIGYAEVRLEMEEVERLIRRNYVVRLAWTLVTMLAGLLALLYLAFLFTRPINTLVAGAHQVAQGNLHVSLPVRGTDEMGRLAATFNQMVEHLRQNRELQERLNQAEKLSLLGRFAATVAHEVRNSLNFINLSIDQIRAKHLSSEERAARDLQRNLNNVKDEISRLNHMVNDFLAAGRQAPPDFAACDLEALVGEAVALVEKQAHAQEVTITTALPADLPVLRADAGQMKTCFLNILTNAVQAMPQGGAVRVTASCMTGEGIREQLQLRFVDTGPGIPPEDRERVFAPYFSTKTTGFGLGLAITKKIVEDHGGRIYVTDGDTSGTMVVVELPLPEPSISRASVAEAPSAA